MTNLEKIEFIRWAIRDSQYFLTKYMGEEDCDLVQALEFLEELYKSLDH